VTFRLICAHHYVTEATLSAALSCHVRSESSAVETTNKAADEQLSDI